MPLTPVVLWALRGAIVFATALVATSLLRRASASTRHLVLLASFVAVLALPVLTAIAPGWSVAPAPFAADGLPDGALGVSVDVPASQHDARAPEWRVEVASLPERSLHVSPVPLVFGGWAMGTLLLLARLAVGVGRARRVVRGGVSIDELPVAATLRDARDALGEADVRLSDAVDVPSVTGAWSPVVLLPRVALAWDAERCRHVLLHELAHVRRRDCFTQMVAAVACAVCWFDPFAWLAARRMRRERELAADEDAVAAGARASSYAGHLVAIAAMATREVPTGALAMAQPSELERRVRALVAPELRPRVRPAIVVGGACAIAFAVACASPASSPMPMASSFAAAASAPRSGPTTALADAVARAIGAPASRTELTIDPSLQAIADDEIARVVAEWNADAASTIVLDPSTGEVLAIAGRSPSDAPALSMERAYGPASTIKPFVVAAALDEKSIAADQRFFCENGQRAYGAQVLRDHGAFGWLDVPQILATSSNVGASKVFDALGGAKLGRWLARFHFGERPSVQIANAASGAVPASIPSGFDGAVVALGEGVSASQLQVAAAYAALANDGVYNAPTLVRRVVGDDGRATWEHRPTRERIVSSATARAVMTMLEQAVAGERSTGRAARIDGVRVAGKTGTGDLQGSREGAARTYATFVGVVPADRPRFVVLVGVEVRGDDASGPKVAAPAFARIAARALR